MICPAKKFLVRTPLLSFNSINGSGLPEDLPAFFESGLYLASQSLYREYLKLRSLPKTEQIKVERSLAKYWLRACTRATPFATYAGLAAGNITNANTNLVLQDSEQHYVSLRLDMDLVAAIVAQLHTMPEIVSQLKFTVNNSLYRVSSGFRYAEYQLAKGIRKYDLVNLEKTTHLSAILEAARQPVLFQEILALIQNETGADINDAKDYLQTLIESQILISELEPSITGEDALLQLTDKLGRLKDVQAISDSLNDIRQLVRNGDGSVAHLQKVDAAITAIGMNSKLPAITLQADLYLKPVSLNLNNDLVDEIVNQGEALFALARPFRHPDLIDFKTDFLNRYEGRIVPLAIALDADLGIGYAGVGSELSAETPLVEGLAAGAKSSWHIMDINPLHSFTFAKYELWQQTKTSYIEITDKDLQPFAEAAKGLCFPESMHIMGSLLKQDGQLDAQHFLFDLTGIRGPSAGNLLGRFTYGDNKILELTHELLAAEEAMHPDVIFAEIAHLPQARAGNILFRPLLRQYEIPYVGLSGAPEDRQVKLEDLWVKVEGDEVVLWSSKHDKRIIPRLTTAHNFSYQSLPVYKFLCDLQVQGLSIPAIWDWGILDSMKHLPRVTYKNIILRKAYWQVAEEDLGDLSKDVKTTHEAVQEWRTATGLPERVVYTEGDNELLIDFTQHTGRDLLLHYLKKYRRVRLEEFLFTKENAAVHNEEGEPFTNEIVIPFTRTSEKKIGSIKPSFSNTPKRSFLPGSEWVYYKIYSGPKTAEAILKASILPLVERGLREKLFAQFFFIRYKDDAPHLRLRFYAPERAARQELNDAFFRDMEPLLEQGIIQKVSCDTYVRELERYGVKHIALAEQLFHNDSLSVLRFINLLDGPQADLYRMLFALRGIDLLLDDFGLSLSEKHSLLGSIKQGFFQEFGSHSSLQKILNGRYRQHQKAIFLHMDESRDVANEIDDAVAVFQVRAQMNQPIIQALKSGASKEQWLNWLPSYIHMFMNRLFIAQQRKYELVIYHFLEKYYNSQLSILKKNQVTDVAVN